MIAGYTNLHKDSLSEVELNPAELFSIGWQNWLCSQAIIGKVSQQPADGHWFPLSSTRSPPQKMLTAVIAVKFS